MLFRIFNDVVDKLSSCLGVGHAELSEDGSAFSEFSLAVYKSEVLHNIIGIFLALDTAPTDRGADSEGVNGEAVTDSVIADASLCHLAFDRHRPLCNLIHRDLLGGAVGVIVIMAVLQ